MVSAKVLMERAQARTQKKSILVNGVRCDYWFYPAKRANAKNLVVVHGYRGDHHGLESFAGGLEEFNVYSPDIPGFGSSQPLEVEHNLENYVDWLINFTNAVGLVRPVAIGHSFGTLLVCGAESKKPTFEAIVCINPVAGGVTKGLSRFLMQFVKGYYWLAHKMPEAFGLMMLKTPLLVDSMSAYTTKSRDKALRYWIKKQHQMHFNSFANSHVVWESYVASVSHTLQPFVGNLKCPMLLVAAEKDEVTPVSAVIKLADRLPNARMYQIYNCGHLVHYEAAEETVEQIIAFVNDLKS
ncbi:MAG: hypothetical protein RL523_167 [Actinomycetota bacterium]|jgi:pimeloyl-ACP methyl ester carboxylesterase